MILLSYVHPLPCVGLNSDVSDFIFRCGTADIAN